MKTLLLLFASALAALAQTTPDCQFTYTAAIATSQTPPINNRFTTAGGPNGCSAWTFKYWTNAASATSVQIEGAADAVVAGVHVPSGSYTALTVAAPTGSGTNPATVATAGGAALCCDYYPWIRITVNTLTSSGAGTIIEVRAYGYRQNSAVNGNSGSGLPSGAAGGDLSGFYPNPNVAQVNGAAVPTSAAVLGSNASKQLVATDANGLNAPTYVAGAGIAQAQTATLVPAITALVAGRTSFCWLPLHANTGAAPTMAPNGLTATAIVKGGGAALVAGDIGTAVACVIYDGTYFELQNPQVAPSVYGTASAVYTVTSGFIPLIPTTNAAGLYTVDAYIWSTPTYGGVGATCTVGFLTNNGTYGTSSVMTPIGLVGAADSFASSFNHFSVYAGASQGLTYQVTIVPAVPTGNCNVVIGAERVF